jgi:hypothetical protein
VQSKATAKTQAFELQIKLGRQKQALSPLLVPFEFKMAMLSKEQLMAVETQADPFQV